MKRMGRKEKSVFACMLSLAMFAQCLSASAVSVGADETAPLTEEKVTDEAENQKTPQGKKSEDKATMADQTAEKPEEEKTDNNANELSSTKQAADKKTAPTALKSSVAGQEPYIKDVSFTVKSDGTEPFDETEADGNDTGAHNHVIRSFDQMTYQITTTYQAPENVSVKGKKIYYAITVPNDDNLELQGSKEEIGSIADADKKVNDDGTKTYTFCRELDTNMAEGAGSFNFPIHFNVLGMKKGDEFQPSLKCWFEGNTDNKTPEGETYKNEQGKSGNEVTTEQTTVTSVPAYNIILKPGSLAGISSFTFNSVESKNFFDQNSAKYTASNYPNQTVKGYKVTWGVAVEMRRTDTSKGLRGVELPDATKNLTFDVDLSGLYKPDKNSEVSTNDWAAPLLYQVRQNKGSDRFHVNQIPGSNKSTGESENDNLNSCLNSGVYQVSQTGSTLHFEVSGYRIERDKLPKASLNGQSTYWTDLSKILEGVFTSAQFSVVYPIEKQDGSSGEMQDLRDTYGKTGNFTFSAAAKDMSVTSVGNHVSTDETVPANADDYDNVASMSANVVDGHGRSQEVYFSCYANQTGGSDNGVAGSQNNKGNDSDSATIGSQIFFSTCWSETNASIDSPIEGRTVAADQLVLMEGDAIEMQSASRRGNVVSHGYKLYPMYATADHALSFEETKTLDMTSDKLSYYNDLRDVPAGQYVVGVLLRWRGISYSVDKKGKDENAGMATLVAQTVAKIRDEAKYNDKVYAITVQSKLYDTSILPDVAQKTYATPLEEADAYREAARKQLLGDKPLCRINSNLQTEYQGDLDDRIAYTTKPHYDNTGYHEGTDFSRVHADAIYIVPYYTQITKTIAQRTKDGNQKETYDLGKGQRYVDYKLTSSMNFTQDGINFADGKNKTTVTITDTIPSGLTYVVGSAKWGVKTYTEHPGGPGTTEGGQAVTETISTNSDGSTKVTWTIPDVKIVSGELPALYYSCKINNGLNTETQLKNTAYIRTAEDQRDFNSYNKNMSEAGIKLKTEGGFNINKYGDHDLELNDKASFTLVASNAQTTLQTNLLMVDSMPVDGENGTIKKGNYKVTSLTINDDATVIGENGIDDIEVYYTSDQQYAGKKELNGLTIDQVKTWTKASKTKEKGKDPSWDVTGWPAAIAIVDPSLGEFNTIFATIHYEETAQKTDEQSDHLVNYLIVKGQTTSSVNDVANTVVYDRALSGTVWIDENFNGQMDANEEKVSGVKVQLMQEDENGKWVALDSYEDVDGKKCSGVQYTDQNGFYEFTRLKKGKYKVIFTSGDKTDSPAESDLSQYSMTDKKKNGTATTVTSKTDAKKDTEGKLSEGDITGISMPTIDEMKKNQSTHYELPDQNMGLYRVDRGISGMAWFDADADGIYDKDADGDEKEYPMAGVTATLYTYNQKTGEYEPCKIAGRPVTTTTGADGSYHFDKIPAGKYEVVFSNGTGSNARISGFDVTKSGQGADPDVRSVAKSGKEGTAVVSSQNNEEGEEIQLKTDQTLIKERTSRQEIPNLNAGFMPKPVNIKITKVWKDDNNKDNIRPKAEDFSKDLILNRYCSSEKNGKTTGKASVVSDNVPHIAVNKDGSFTVEYRTLKEVSFDGQKFTHYVYKVSEKKIEGYTSDKDEVSNGEILTNTHTPDKKVTPKPSEKPNKPTDTPENPNKPEEPTNPDKPVIPENPSKPEEPVNPENPTEPENPNKPVKPEKPAKPSNPSGTPKTTPEEPTKKPGKKTDTPKTTPKVTETPAPSEPTKKPGKKTDTPKTTPKTTGTPEKPAAPSATRHSHYFYVTNNFVTTNNDTTVSSRDDVSVRHTTTGTAPVKTGDHTHAELYLALVILAGAFITGKARKSRKARHK